MTQNKLIVSNWKMNLELTDSKTPGKQNSEIKSNN